MIIYRYPRCHILNRIEHEFWNGVNFRSQQPFENKLKDIFREAKFDYLDVNWGDINYCQKTRSNRYSSGKIKIIWTEKNN